MSKELAAAMPDAGTPDPEAQQIAADVIAAGQDLPFDIEAAYRT